MKHKSQINGQFAPRTIAMLRSPAMRAVGLTGRRILDRIEIELANHGGRDNGKLPVTFADLKITELAAETTLRVASANCVDLVLWN